MREHLKTIHSIPVIFNVHVEPDMRIIKYKKTRWNGYENLHEFLFNIRPILEKATGRNVYYNWLFRLDPQIHHAYGQADWAIHQYRSLINEAIQAGDELGVHVHSWRPTQKWLYKSWIADFKNLDWIENCVNMAHQAFIDCFHVSPKAFSFGDHYMSSQVLSQLQSLGYRYDISMYPGRPLLRRIVNNEKSAGWLPSYVNTPRRPFKPSYLDFTRPIAGDEMSIWEIPVSTGHIIKPDNPHMESNEKLLLGIPFAYVQSIVNQNLALPDPYLLAEMRTDVRMNNFNRLQFDKAIDFFCQHPLINNMSISTVASFADHLENKNQDKQSSQDIDCINVAI